MAKSSNAKKTPKIAIKKGDTVKVIAGKDKGAEGKVIKVLREEERLIVEGVNRIKKHTKVGQSTRGAKTGGIVTQEASVHVSNVMLVVEVDGKKVGSRVGYRVEKVERDGREKTVRVRYAKRTGEDI